MLQPSIALQTVFDSCRSSFFRWQRVRHLVQLSELRWESPNYAVLLDYASDFAFRTSRLAIVEGKRPLHIVSQAPSTR